VLHLLNRQVGEISTDVMAQIQELLPIELKSLIEALLEFEK
jgi:Domain of unknown function (DUF4351)